MRTIFGFILPLLITLIHIIYLFIFGKKRLLTGNGYTIFQTSGIALLIGVVTPIIAMVTSILMLSMIDQNSDQYKCYTFVTGYIGIGIIIELVLIPITVIILKIVEETKGNIS